MNMPRTGDLVKFTYRHYSREHYVFLLLEDAYNLESNEGLLVTGLCLYSEDGSVTYCRNFRFYEYFFTTEILSRVDECV